MSHAGYIVDSATLSAIPPGVALHAESIPGSTKSLVAIDWHGSENHGAAFEARSDILHLGLGETLLAEAAALLASMALTATPLGKVVATPSSATPDTVASALRKVDSPVARLIRWR